MCRGYSSEHSNRTHNQFSGLGEAWTPALDPSPLMPCLMGTLLCASSFHRKTGLSPMLSLCPDEPWLRVPGTSWDGCWTAFAVLASHTSKFVV